MTQFFEILREDVVGLWIFFIILWGAYGAEETDLGFGEYESKLEVPEPLFVDLVRGLNSAKGEWEVNALIAHSQGYFRDVEWAPEIEWVVAKGMALEFEFPMIGDSLHAYKTAFQKTLFGSARDDRTAHGIQLIYEAEKDFHYSEGTIFYILAHRWSHQLSTIILTGTRFQLQSSEDWAFLWNQSFFYNHSREVDLGLEINWTVGKSADQFLQVVPQLHLALGKGYKIQFGWGAREDQGHWSPAGILRVIKELNHPR